jgi:hypothetical protein
MNPVGFLFLLRKSRRVAGYIRILAGAAAALLGSGGAVASGTLITWGGGQPSPPGGLDGVATVSMAVDHSLALKRSGTVAAWGANFDGQCNVPPGLADVIQVAAGEFFSAALKSDGTVVVWGSNDYAQRDVPPNLRATAISAGHAHCLALKSDGTVAGWGSDAYGQIDVPAGLNSVRAVFALWNYSLALKTDGTVIGWGVNDSGQIAVPANLSGVVTLAGNQRYVLALGKDGTVIQWGRGPAPPAGLNGVVAIAAGETHALALRSDGSVVAWGSNASGETSVTAGLSGITSLAAGWHYSGALSGGTSPILDTNSPTISITSAPADQSRLTNSSVQLAGQATDDVAVALIEWQLVNSAGASSWHAASGTGYWSASVENLLPGVNTISVRARDTSQNVSVTVSRNYVLLSPLTIPINGCGHLEPELAFAFLEPGATYSVSAVPCAGYRFNGWTGTAMTNDSTLRFVMQPGMTFAANFVPAQFTPVKGSYSGLFFVEDGITASSSGFLTVATTTRRTFSGKLQLGGASFPFKGTLSTNGEAQVTVNRRNQNPLTINLQIDLTPGMDRMVGTVSDGTWSAGLLADQAIFDARTNPAPEAGKWTMAILGDPASSTSPTGDGFGTITVDKSGRVRLTGTLADGTKLTQSALLSRDGDWPLFVPLYSGQGAILSRMNLNAAGAGALRGEVRWTKPANSQSKVYPAGFDVNTSAIGSPYLSPSRGNQILPFTSGQLALAGANLPADITNAIQLTAGNRITNLSSNRLTLTFSAATGAFRGSVLNPSDDKPIGFSGVVLQNLNFGRGFFLNAAQSGSVILSAQP